MMDFKAFGRKASKAVLPLTLAATGLSLLGGTKANAQQSYTSAYNQCAATNTLQRDIDDCAQQKMSQSPNQPINNSLKQANTAQQQTNNIDIEYEKYVAQAQKLFATLHAIEIVNNTTKLYAKAVENGFALRPGLYAPMKQYFNGLKTAQDQGIAVATLLPSLGKASGHPEDAAMTPAMEYADYMEKSAAKGQISIISHFKDDVLLRQPSGVPGAEVQRIAIASLVGVPYPARQTIALNGVRPTGQ